MIEPCVTLSYKLWVKFKKSLILDLLWSTELLRSWFYLKMKYHILDRNSLSWSSKVWPSLKQHQQGHQFLMDLASLQIQLNGNLKKPDIIQKELGADLKRECCAQSCGLGLQRPQIHTQPFLPSRQRSSSAIDFSCASLFAGISSLQNAVSPSDSHDLGVDMGKHRTSTKLPQGLLSNTPGTSRPEGLAPKSGLPKKAWL